MIAIELQLSFPLYKTRYETACHLVCGGVTVLRFLLWLLAINRYRR